MLQCCVNILFEFISFSCHYIKDFSDECYTKWTWFPLLFNAIVFFTWWCSNDFPFYAFIPILFVTPCLSAAGTLKQGGLFKKVGPRASYIKFLCWQKSLKHTKIFFIANWLISYEPNTLTNINIYCTNKFVTISKV